jgi:hypothetical protein
LAVALLKSGSADSPAPASLRKIFFHLPSLPGNAGELLLRSAFGGKQQHGIIKQPLDQNYLRAIPNLVPGIQAALGARQKSMGKGIAQAGCGRKG